MLEELSVGASLASHQAPALPQQRYAHLDILSPSATPLGYFQQSSSKQPDFDEALGLPPGQLPHDILCVIIYYWFG